MKSVFLCHAPEDAGAAAELKKFLEAGTCYDVDAGALPPGETVATWYDHGGADAVVLLLSPRAVPAQWRVEEWQGVLDELERGTLASLVAAPCRKPQRLERRSYFESGNLRGVKQWLLGVFSGLDRVVGLPSPHPAFPPDEAEMNVLRCAVGDRAGRARLGGSGGTLAAIDFAHRFGDDFERVVWSHCGDGTAEGAASDLAMRLGLRLSGPLEADIDAIAGYVGDKRYLLVLDGPPSELLEDTGTSSLIVAGGGIGRINGIFHYEHEFRLSQPAPEPSPTLDAVARLPGGCSSELAKLLAGVERPSCEDLFGAGALLRIGASRYWSPVRRPEALTVADATVIMRHLVRHRDPEDLANAEAALRRVLREPVSEAAWDAAKKLKSVACSVAHDHGRVVEVHALVSLLEPYARARGDMKTQEDCLRERRWIEGGWGSPTAPVESEEDPRVRQLELEL